MSRLIDLVETFDFTALESQAYIRKIDGLLKRFPKYEKDDNFRTVLPHKSIRTADDYISMKFCTKGRYPIYGIYSRRDLDLVGVCVEGNIMYALDDCDLHPSFVPDLHVRKLCLGIQNSDLATRETPSYTKGFMHSAISALSLGYIPEKKNEWCEAIVLLSGMTTQAVRFHKIKKHIADGLCFVETYLFVTPDGRHELHTRYLGMQNRWNKCSKAIRRGEYPYVYSIYGTYGKYQTAHICQYRARMDVSLINDRNKTRREIYKRRTDRWNGPLDNSKRKRKEQHSMMSVMKRMHGSWHGSVDAFRYDIPSANCFPRLAQMVRTNRFLVSATPLGCVGDVFQVQTAFTSIHLAVKIVRNGGGLVAFFREPGSFVQLGCGRISRALEATCVYPFQTRMQVQHFNLTHTPYIGVVDLFRRSIMRQHEGLRGFYMTTLKIWIKEHGSFVQLDCGKISRALAAACVYPLQTRMQVQHSNVTHTPYIGVVDLFRRRIMRQHEGLRSFYMIALKVWIKGLRIKK